MLLFNDIKRPINFTKGKVIIAHARSQFMFSHGTDGKRATTILRNITTRSWTLKQQSLWKRQASASQCSCSSFPSVALTNILFSLGGSISMWTIENYLSSSYSNKYVFQTLPKILTLWLAHAASVDEPLDPKRGVSV